MKTTCDSCRFGITKTFRGRSYSVNGFGYCGHTDNIYKSKIDPVTGKNIVTIIKRKIHLKWNKNLDCERYQKREKPPILHGNN